jgi:hypothetical protein
MNVYVMMNDYPCDGVCLFILAYVLFCMYDTQIDVRSGLWGRRTQLIRGRPTGNFRARQVNSPSVYSICTQLMHIIIFTFLDILHNLMGFT